MTNRGRLQSIDSLTPRLDGLHLLGVIHCLTEHAREVLHDLFLGKRELLPVSAECMASRCGRCGYFFSRFCICGFFYVASVGRFIFGFFVITVTTVGTRRFISGFFGAAVFITVVLVAAGIVVLKILYRFIRRLNNIVRTGTTGSFKRCLQVFVGHIKKVIFLH